MKIITVTAMAFLLAAPVLSHEAPAGKTVEISSPANGSKARAESSGAKTHSGGTDARGCHTNHQTGDYHCHKPK